MGGYAALHPARPTDDSAMPLPSDLLKLLRCPKHRTALTGEAKGDALRCPEGCRFPVVGGVPVLLPPDEESTHPEGERARRLLSEPELASEWEDVPPPVHGIDGFVQSQVSATCGRMFLPLIGQLREYPIPDLRLPLGEGRLYVELGCNWGRWCIAAARLGYRVIGIDPSLRGLLAGRRVAEQLGVEVHQVCADARVLPLADESADVVFSYSVLQHLAREHVRSCVREAARVLAPGGLLEVQMANERSVLGLMHGLRRGFREAKDFEVRYWTPSQLRELGRLVGESSVRADGYLNLNPQPSEAHLLRPHFRALIAFSELLRHASDRWRPLSGVADSLWLTARKAAAGAD